MDVKMGTSTKFSIALYHQKTTISVRTKRFFADDPRYANGRRRCSL